MRRFELVAGTSSKFWQIDQRGRELVAGWGRIGTAGQGNVKQFATEAAAAAQLDKQIRRKLAEGYHEIGGTQAKAAAPPPMNRLSTLIALHGKTLAALAASDVVDSPKPKPPTRIAEAKLRAWETKFGVTLPADLVGFLSTFGTFRYEWWFRADDGAEYDFAHYDLDVRMPKFDSPDGEIAWFASEDGNNSRWGVRLRPRLRSPALVFAGYKAEPKELPESFTQWLTDKLTFFGRKEEFAQSARRPKSGQLADLAVLAKKARLRPGKSATSATSATKKGVAPTTLRALCSLVKIESNLRAKLTFRKDVAPNASLAGLLPPELTSLHLIDPPAELELDSLVALEKLTSLNLTLSTPNQRTPPLLLALGARTFQSIKWLEIHVPFLDDLSFARAFPNLEWLQIYAFKGAVPADLSSVSATDLLWYGVEPDFGENPTRTKGSVRVSTKLTVAPTLKKLALYDMAATQLPEIHGGTALASIQLSGGRIAKADLAAFAPSSSKLDSVDLDDVGAVHVQNLARLKKLTSLNLFRNKLATLAGLDGLARLQMLTLIANPMRDFSWMGELSPRCEVTLSESLPDKVKAELVATYGKRLKLEFMSGTH